MDAINENGYRLLHRVIPRHHGVCKTRRGRSRAGGKLMRDASCVLSTAGLSFSYGGRITVECRPSAQARITDRTGSLNGAESQLLHLLEARPSLAERLKEASPLG